ncbi:hypothetical protein B1690_16960 [Geobacillus sp. 46C-IIa]|nr:hypothetical protein B1690_16960 [Geobacillus sp. 46C-IIa]
MTFPGNRVIVNDVGNEDKGTADADFLFSATAITNNTDAHKRRLPPETADQNAVSRHKKTRQAKAGFFIVFGLSGTIFSPP